MSAPTVTCATCGATETVTPDGRGFPPDIARRRLWKRCGHPKAQMRYRAGFAVGGPIAGQAPTTAGDPETGQP